MPAEGAEPGHDACDVLPVVYDELRRLAAAYLGDRAATLQPTALVHEAYLKCDSHQFRDRAHFKAVAATAMRQVLVDHFRRAGAEKRVAPTRVTLDGLVDGRAMPVDAVALDDALSRLATLDARKARVVELRVFGGLTLEEAAEALGVSRVTVSKDWRFARAWIAAALTGETLDDA